MKEALKIYYGQIFPELWERRKWGLLVILWFIFHLGPLVARSDSDLWEQPLTYATF